MSDEDFWVTVERIAAGEAALDDIAKALAYVEAKVSRANNLQSAMDAALLGLVQMRGPLLIGDVSYYAGYRTMTIAKDKFAVLDALLIHTHGDVKTTASLLVAQPFKYGSIRNLLPRPTFSTLFRVVRETQLGMRLMTAETRFLRRSPSSDLAESDMRNRR